MALPAAGFAGSHEPGCRRSLRDGEPTATITAGAYVKWRVAALPCVCDLCAVWTAQLRAEMAGVRVCVRVRLLTAVRFLTEACEETGEFLRRRFLARGRFLRRGSNGFYDVEVYCSTRPVFTALVAIACAATHAPLSPLWKRNNHVNRGKETTH